MSLPLWFKDAACKETKTSEFYNYSDKLDQQAIAICVTCPVIDECLLWAIAHDEPGVWGGTTEGERTTIAVRSRVQEVPVTVLRRSIQRGRERLARAGPASSFRTLNQQRRNLELAEMAAALHFSSRGDDKE